MKDKAAERDCRWEKSGPEHTVDNVGIFYSSVLSPFADG